MSHDHCRMHQVFCTMPQTTGTAAAGATGAAAGGGTPGAAAGRATTGVPAAVANTSGTGLGTGFVMVLEAGL